VSSQLDGAMPGISVICVYNNEAVRRDCLDRSLADYSGPVDVDYIPIDNREHHFSSAGAALNEGVRRARHELLALVHQDVYLHSVDRLVSAGADVLDGGWGLLGANGVSEDGVSVGRLRDRSQMLGCSAPAPVDVDSVDEVLFLVPRQLLLDHPLSEDADLAWHAYAVEYSLRLRRLGKRVGAVDLAITHNSLTVNLDRLDVAHRRVGAVYQDLRPIRTTCGTIGVRESRWRDLPVVRAHRWRLRWLRESLVALRARRLVDAPVVLADIRREVDAVPLAGGAPLHLLNLDPGGAFALGTAAPLRLTRYDRTVMASSSATVDDVVAALDSLPSTDQVLVADLQLEDLGRVVQGVRRQRDWTVGVQPGSFWLLGGVRAQDLPTAWSRPQAVPLVVGGRRAAQA
jgi:hypothetical protein